MANRFFKASELGVIQTITPIKLSSFYNNNFYFIEAYDIENSVADQILALENVQEITESELIQNTPEQP